MKKLSKKLVCILAALSLAGCGSGGSGTASGPAPSDSSPAAVEKTDSKEGRVVNVSDVISLINLEVYANNNSCEFLYSDLVFDPLYYGDREGNNTPCICTSYDLNEDGTEAILHLKEGVKFHDGTDLNAKDVVATFEFMKRNMDTLALASAVWPYLEGAEYVDDNTVKLRMTQYFATFETALSYTWVLSDEDIEKYGDDFQSAEKIINGSGPWKYEDWVDGQYLKVSRNEDYWDKENISNIDTLYVWYISQENAKVSGMISGEIDFASTLRPDMIPMVEGQKGIEVIEYVADVMHYLQFDCAEDSIFNDINARKAVAHALDRNTMLDLVGGGEAMNCMFLRSLAGFDESIPGYEYNPELAKEYLAKTGYNGEELTIYTRNDLASIDDVMAVFVENLSAVGFNITTKLCDSAEFVAIRQDPTAYDLFFVTLGGFDGDPYSLYIIPRIVDDCHHSYYVNEELNNLITDSYKTTDAAKRDEMLKSVAKTVYDECGPVLAVYTPKEYCLIREGLEGVNATKCAGPYFRYIHVDENVWGK